MYCTTCTLPHLFASACNSIDRSVDQTVHYDRREKKRKKRKKRKDEIYRERESLDISLHKVFSLQEITYISLEYPDGKDNQARIQTR